MCSSSIHSVSGHPGCFQRQRVGSSALLTTVNYLGAAAPHTPPRPLGAVLGFAVGHPETAPKASQPASAHCPRLGPLGSEAAGPRLPSRWGSRLLPARLQSEL